MAGKAGIDLSVYSIVLYNGSNGAVYNTTVLSGSIDDEQNGYGAVAFNFGAIQNGPDAIALVGPSNNVVQFLSYEGIFMATDGPANGMVSEDFGFSGSSSSSGLSIQLQGTGTEYSDFIWVEEVTQSYNIINPNQTFSTLTITDNNLENIKLFPNPTKQLINLKADYILNYKVFNNLGQLVKKGELNIGGNAIDLSNQNAGLYFIQLSNRNKSTVKKIFKI